MLGRFESRHVTSAECITVGVMRAADALLRVFSARTVRGCAFFAIRERISGGSSGFGVSMVLKMVYCVVDTSSSLLKTKKSKGTISTNFKVLMSLCDSI